MKTKELIVELNDIRIDHSLSENQEYVVDEIIEKLIGCGDVGPSLKEKPGGNIMTTKELIEFLKEDITNVLYQEHVKEIIKRLEELEELKRREVGLIKDWLRERKWRQAQDETLRVIKRIINM